MIHLTLCLKSFIKGGRLIFEKKLPKIFVQKNIYDFSKKKKKLSLKKIKQYFMKSVLKRLRRDQHVTQEASIRTPPLT